MELHQAIKAAYPCHQPSPLFASKVDSTLRSRLARRRIAQVTKRTVWALASAILLWGSFTLAPSSRALAIALAWQRSMVGVRSVTLEQVQTGPGGKKFNLSRSVQEEGRWKGTSGTYRPQYRIDGMDFRYDGWLKSYVKTPLPKGFIEIKPTQFLTLTMIGLMFQYGTAKELTVTRTEIEGKPCEVMTVKGIHGITLRIFTDPRSGRPFRVVQEGEANGLPDVRTYEVTYEESRRDDEFDDPLLKTAITQGEWIDKIAKQIASMPLKRAGEFIVRDVQWTKSGSVAILMQSEPEPLDHSSAASMQGPTLVISDSLGRRYPALGIQPVRDANIANLLKKSTGYSSLTLCQAYADDRADETPEWIKVGVLVDPNGKVVNSSLYRVSPDGSCRPWRDSDKSMPNAKYAAIATVRPDSAQAMDRPDYANSSLFSWMGQDMIWKQRGFHAHLAKRYDEAVHDYERSLQESEKNPGFRFTYDETIEDLKRAREHRMPSGVSVR